MCEARKGNTNDMQKHQYHRNVGCGLMNLFDEQLLILLSACPLDLSNKPRKRGAAMIITVLRHESPRDLPCRASQASFVAHGSLFAISLNSSAFHRNAIW